MAHHPTSSTGDLNNNCEKLKSELIRSKYSGPVEVRTLKRGNPTDLLPLVHFALLGFSKFLHDDLVAKGYDLFAKTDIRFLEATYKLLRNEFEYQPQLRVDQFFSDGFVERKIILVHDLLKLCQLRHIELKRTSNASKLPGGRRPQTAGGPRGLPQQVIRHQRTVSTSLLGSGNFSDHQGLLDNEERGMPRTAAPPVPTPTPMAPVPRAHTAPSLMLAARARSPQTLEIDGAGHVRQTEAYGQIDDVEYGDDGVFYGTNVGYGEKDYEEKEDYSEDDELFAPKEKLAVKQQQKYHQHSSAGGCHNDALVLKMSETLLHMDARCQQLEARCYQLTDEVVSHRLSAEAADKVKEEVQARLTLAEGRVRMLEQRVNEIVCDQVVSRAFSPDSRAHEESGTAGKKHHGMGEQGTDLHHDNSKPSRQSYFFASHNGLAGSGGRTYDERAWMEWKGQEASRKGQEASRKGQEASSMEWKGQEASSVRGPERSNTNSNVRLGTSGGRSSTSAVSDVDSFIASISQRFKETNQLLSQSRASLAERDRA